MTGYHLFVKKKKLTAQRQQQQQQHSLRKWISQCNCWSIKNATFGHRRYAKCAAKVNHLLRILCLNKEMRSDKHFVWKSFVYICTRFVFEMITLDYSIRDRRRLVVTGHLGVKYRVYGSWMEVVESISRKAIKFKLRQLSHDYRINNKCK